jgi:CBS domain containing-hemolysin-like protein
MGPKLYFGFYFDMPAITVVVNKAQRVLKFKPVDFGTGLKESYRWYLRHSPFSKPDYTFEDALIEAAEEEGILQESDRQLIQSVVEFGDKTVREVMTPRPNIFAVPSTTTIEEYTGMRE